MATKGVAGLNVYKKIAIIRKADDVLTYEDNDGNVKTITDLHLAAAATVSTKHNSRWDFIAFLLVSSHEQMCVVFVTDTDS